MPRKVTSTNEGEIVRAPRRQVARRKTASRTKRVIKIDEESDLAPKKAERRVVTEDTEDVVPERKAPTKISQNKRSWRPSRKLIVVGLVLMSGLGATLWIGFSDQGQIDVSAKIVERNNEIMAGVRPDGDENSATIAKSQIVPVQNTNTTVPNGGLRGRGVGTAKVEQPNVPLATSTATSTASSTSDIATSTEDVSDNANNTSDNETTSDVEETNNTENDGTGDIDTNEIDNESGGGV